MKNDFRNELKRRDKILIVLFSLSALVMAVANPTDLNIRSVAFDISMLLIPLCVIFWMFSEVGDQLTDMIIGNVSYSGKISKKDTVGMSRIELLDLASETSGISSKSLESMSDIELAGIIEKTGVSTGSSNIAPLHVIIIALVKLAIKVMKFVMKMFITGPRAIKNLPNTIKDKFSVMKKMWIEEMAKP